MKKVNMVTTFYHELYSSNGGGRIKYLLQFCTLLKKDTSAHKPTLCTTHFDKYSYL